MIASRPGRLLAIALALAFLAGGAVLAVRWLLGPDNLAQVIGNWVGRELDAELVLGQPPGIRLLPRLQLTLDEVRIERDGQELAAVEQLSLALPWSILWREGLHVESLVLRGPRLTWPALGELLAAISGDGDAPARAPTLPRIAVGLRVENGTLIGADEDSGGGAEEGDDQPWRIERISLLTTPLRPGRPFHLDAGARLHGGQLRTLSLTASTRPGQAGDSLQLEELSLRLIVSPDNQPAVAEAAISLDGRVHLAEGGIALVELDGRLPGWPEWAPALPAFAPDRALAISARQPRPQAPLAIALRQPATAPAAGGQAASGAEPTGGQDTAANAPDARSLAIVVQPDSLQEALALRARPLHALAALRLQAAINRLDLGPVQLHDLRLDIDPGASTGPDAPADTDIDTDTDAAPEDGANRP